MSDPTPAELAALRIYWREGDYARTAAVLGISEQAVRGRLRRVRRRLGVDSTMVAIYRLRDRLVA